jgi:hypothetical protein
MPASNLERRKDHQDPHCFAIVRLYLSPELDRSFRTFQPAVRQQPLLLGHGRCQDVHLGAFEIAPRLACPGSLSIFSLTRSSRKAGHSCGKAHLFAISASALNSRQNYSGVPCQPPAGIVGSTGGHSTCLTKHWDTGAPLVLGRALS